MMVADGDCWYLLLAASLSEKHHGKAGQEAGSQVDIAAPWLGDVTG